MNVGRCRNVAYVGSLVLGLPCHEFSKVNLWCFDRVYGF